MSVPATAPADAGFRRLLVALDSTSDNLATVNSVVALAARLGAELRGVFVEDMDLLDLLRVAGPEPGADADGRVRRALRVQAGLSRQALEKAARRSGVATSFEVRRGRIAAEILASSAQADLTIIGWSSGGFAVRAAGFRGRPGSVARTVAEGAKGSVLLLRQGFDADGPVLVPYDDSTAARRALAVASAVAHEKEREIMVLLLNRRAELTDAWKPRVREILAARGRGAKFVRLPAATVGPGVRTGIEQVCWTARTRRARLVVLGSGLALIRGAAARRLLEGIDNSVLLVR